MIMFKVNVRLITLKLSHLTWEECGMCPDCTCYTLAFTLQMRVKAREEPVTVVVKVLSGRELMYQDDHLLWVARTSCRSQLPCFRGPASMLGQCRYLLSSVTKGFPTSTKFESNLPEI